MMNVLSVPVVFSTWTGLPARAVIHSLTSSQPLLRQRRPAFPRRLISWSGLATSFSEKTQSGRPAPGEMGGVRVLVAASLTTRGRDTDGQSRGLRFGPSEKKEEGAGSAVGTPPSAVRRFRPPSALVRTEQVEQIGGYEDRHIPLQMQQGHAESRETGAWGGRRQWTAEAAVASVRARARRRSSDSADNDRLGKTRTYHWTWATRTGVAVDGPDVGVDVLISGSQCDSSSLASYSRIAGDGRPGKGGRFEKWGRAAAQGQPNAGGPLPGRAPCRAKRSSWQIVRDAPLEDMAEREEEGRKGGGWWVGGAGGRDGCWKVRAAALSLRGRPTRNFGSDALQNRPTSDSLDASPTMLSSGVTLTPLQRGCWLVR